MTANHSHRTDVPRQASPAASSRSYRTLGTSAMAGFHCSGCGRYHPELPLCLGSLAPALWFSLPEEERSTRALLSSDQCIIDGQHFFILGRLLLPIQGSLEPFVWLTWVSLSEKNFARASDLWHTESREAEPPYFAWVQSSLPCTPSTLSLRAELVTMPLGQRPLVRLEPTDHPLAVEQRNGIAMARVQEIAEGALHGAAA